MPLNVEVFLFQLSSPLIYIFTNFAHGIHLFSEYMHSIRYFILLFTISLGLTCAQAQSMQNMAYLQYIDQFKDLAIEQMERYRIPASITLAQGLFESCAGQSRLATVGNNHFGIKCHGWDGRSINADDDEPDECFRAYDNAKQSYEDHSRFLRNTPRYAMLFQLSPNDYKGWARGLKACGYATNPRYADNLINIIELYRLYQYDHAKGYDHFMADRYNARSHNYSPNGFHPITKCNKNYYIVARDGDTFRSLAKETDISRRKLAKYNERDKNDVLHAGDIIYLEKKQKRASKVFKGKPHIVKVGESMYSIAQLYGIRLKDLYKMNHMSPDDSIVVGQQLKVR